MESDEHRIARLEKELAEERKTIDEALGIILQYGGTDGAHHKAWVLDQTLRILTNCPKVRAVTSGAHEYEPLGESEEYTRIIAEYCGGEDGPQTYEHDIGIAP